MKLQLVLLTFAVVVGSDVVVNAVDWFGRNPQKPARERNTELAYGYEVAGSDPEPQAPPCGTGEKGCKGQKECCDGYTCVGEDCVEGGGSTCSSTEGGPCALDVDGAPSTDDPCCASGYKCQPNDDVDWESPPPYAGTCTEDNGSHRVTFCHATGSSKNPWVRLTTSKSGWESGHNQPSHQDGKDFLIIDWGGPIPNDELKKYYEPACPTPKQNNGKCCHKGGWDIPGHGEDILDCCEEAESSPTDPPREDTPEPTPYTPPDTPNPTDPPTAKPTNPPTAPPTAKPTNVPTAPPTPPPTEPKPEECVDLEDTKFDACNPIIPLGSDTKEFPPNNVIFHNLKVLDGGKGLEFSVENPYKASGEDADIFVEYLKLNENGVKENYCEGETKPCETEENRNGHKRYQASCIVADNVPKDDQYPYTGVNIIIRSKAADTKGGKMEESDIPCCCKRHGGEDRDDEWKVTMFSYAIFCGCLPDREDLKIGPHKAVNRDLSEGLEDVQDECDACPDSPPEKGTECNFGTCAYNKCPDSYIVATCSDDNKVEIEDLADSCPEDDETGSSPPQ